MKAKKTNNRHLPRTVIAIPKVVSDQIAPIAGEKLTSLSQIVKEACIEYLERRGKWKPVKQ